MSENWTKEELRASVETYLAMQHMTRSGKKVVKKEYYEKLAKRYGRTEKSYEYRMQNISYVLSVLGREWLTGLRPARNVGARVAGEIESLIAEIEVRTPEPSVVFETQVQLEVAKGKKLVKPVGVKKPKAIEAKSSQFERDPKVKGWVLLQASGVCECCRNPAPFTAADGSKFLEVHHVRRLADGGSDSVENAVALCPNCHRELHHGGNAKELVQKLYAQVSRLVRE